MKAELLAMGCGTTLGPWGQANWFDTQIGALLELTELVLFGGGGGGFLFLLSVA